MNKTLYVSDLDGTLLTPEQTLSSYTIDVINRFIKNGGIFSYATARGYATAAKVTRGLSLGIPAVVQNGAFVTETGTGKQLISNTFSHSEAQCIYNTLTKNGIYPTVYSFIDGRERFSYLTDFVSEGMRRFLDTRRGDERENELSEGSPLLGEVYYFAAIDNAEKLSAVYDILKDDFRCIYSPDIYFDAQWLEIMPRSAGKANSLLALKKMLACDRLICFGDGENDISMFEIADECYAVENASDSLKAIATDIIGSNRNDGVAEWIEKNALPGR